MSETALSLKQPWATLLVHGIKTVEVRRWATKRRGRVLIHAARVPDPRPEAWKHVPAHLKDFAQQAGGIIGAATLIDCVSYADNAKFLAEKGKHLNEDSWFALGLFGFVFEKPEALPFQKFPGWFKFFDVPDPTAAVKS